MGSPEVGAGYPDAGHIEVVWWVYRYDTRRGADVTDRPDVPGRSWVADRFQQERNRLVGVAYRLLGSTSEAEDAVQEAWLRLSRSDPESVENMSAWLTTVVARISLNMLRDRRSRREDPLDDQADRDRSLTTDSGTQSRSTQPEQEAVLADSVGLALLVVLDTLTPAERLAFVLHDMFDLPFDQIAPIVDRSPAAARQLASRARRRLRGAAQPHQDLHRQRRVVEAYLTATRSGDFDALLALLDPNVVLHADRQAGPTAGPTTLNGARAVAGGAVASTVRARVTEPALIDGSVGLVMAPQGRLTVALAFTIVGDTITAIDIIAD
ncbi:MAG TPA: sigma-70 family RNA polymerase sigma factor, partial [Pedococcus sp.]|nr:sigma-70 family RNA polymerase sigma factor [Pedococcus sp.]